MAHPQSDIQQKSNMYLVQTGDQEQFLFFMPVQAHDHDNNPQIPVLPTPHELSNSFKKPELPRKRSTACPKSVKIKRDLALIPKNSNKQELVTSTSIKPIIFRVPESKEHKTISVQSWKREVECIDLTDSEPEVIPHKLECRTNRFELPANVQHLLSRPGLADQLNLPQITQPKFVREYRRSCPYPESSQTIAQRSESEPRLTNDPLSFTSQQGPQQIVDPLPSQAEQYVELVPQNIVATSQQSYEMTFVIPPEVNGAEYFILNPNKASSSSSTATSTPVRPNTKNPILKKAVNLVPPNQLTPNPTPSPSPEPVSDPTGLKVPQNSGLIRSHEKRRCIQVSQYVHGDNDQEEEGKDFENMWTLDDILGKDRSPSPK